MKIINIKYDNVNGNFDIVAYDDNDVKQIISLKIDINTSLAQLNNYTKVALESISKIKSNLPSDMYFSYIYGEVYKTNLGTDAIKWSIAYKKNGKRNIHYGIITSEDKEEDIVSKIGTASLNLNQQTIDEQYKALAQNLKSLL